MPTKNKRMKTARGPKEAREMFIDLARREYPVERINEIETDTAVPALPGNILLITTEVIPRKKMNERIQSIAVGFAK